MSKGTPESPAAMDQLYLRFKGKVTGPFSAKQLLLLFEEGKIGRYHQFSADRKNWKSVEHIPSGAPPVAAQPQKKVLAPKILTSKDNLYGLAPQPSPPPKAEKIVPERPIPRATLQEKPSIEAVKKPRAKSGILLEAFIGIFLVTIAIVIFWPHDRWLAQNAVHLVDVDTDISVLLFQKHWGEVITKSNSTLEEAKKHAIIISTVKELQDIADFKKKAEDALEVLGYSSMLATEDVGKSLQAAGKFQEASERFTVAAVAAQKIEQEDPSAKEIRQRIDVEKANADRAFADAEIQRKQKEVQEAAERRRNQEAEAAKLAEAEHQLEEQQRQREADRLARAEVERQAAIAMFRGSADYKAYKQDADSITADLQTALIGEDSAWRGLSKHTYAAMKMLGVWTDIEAKLHGMNVDLDVRKVIQEVDREQTFEDSAIRAVSNNEEGFGQILGIWIDVLSKDSPALKQAYLTRMADVQRALIGEDSAHRAEQARAEGNMDVLTLILASKGFDKEAQRIISDVSIRKNGETTAQGAAMWSAEGSMSLLLILLGQVDHVQADAISRSVHLETDSDDSILRTHEGYKEGIMRALHGLVDSI